MKLKKPFSPDVLYNHIVHYYIDKKGITIEEANKIALEFAEPPRGLQDERDKEKYVREDGSYYDKRYDTDNQIIFDNFGRGIIEINMITELKLKNKSDKNGEKSI